MVTKRELVSLISLVVLIGICFYFYREHKNNQLKDYRSNDIQKEERIKFLNETLDAQKEVTDSLHKKGIELEAVIEYQKKYPQIIIKKYETQINNVGNLSTDQSIKFLSSKLSSKINH